MAFRRGGVVHYKTESEFNQAQKKAGATRGPQKITTHYTPTKPAQGVTEDKEHIGLEHHAERRSQNRAIRDKVQNTPKEKLKRGVKKAGDYLGPKVQGGLKRFAENAARSSGSDGSGGFHLAPPPDDMFSFQAPSYMMGMPGQEPAPRPAPRKKRKKNKPARRQPREQGQNRNQLGAVPSEVKRWMM
jgi:hypothetical protein